METSTSVKDSNGVIRFRSIFNVDGRPQSLIHREGAPAVIYTEGARRQYWVSEGKLHRIGGPAIIYEKGTQCWYIEGKLHRTDGPAIMHPDGTHGWFLDGKQYTFEDFCKELKLSVGDIANLK